MLYRGRCKHFNGTIRNETCRAGVCYRDVTPDPDRIGSALRLPCNQVLGFSRPSQSQLDEFANRGTCPKYEEPTAAEIAADKARTEAAMERFAKSYPLIERMKKEHRGKDWTGTEKCPVCGGTLHLSHAAVNGHVWGKCETADCLAWME